MRSEPTVTLLKRDLDKQLAEAKLEGLREAIRITESDGAYGYCGCENLIKQRLIELQLEHEEKAMAEMRALLRRRST